MGFFYLSKIMHIYTMRRRSAHYSLCTDVVGVLFNHWYRLLGHSNWFAINHAGFTLRKTNGLLQPAIGRITTAVAI